VLAQIEAVGDERDALIAAQATNEKSSPARMLLEIKGISPECTNILWSEGLFRHFDNRGQVAAYAGLAPTPWQRESIDREQGVSKGGIRDYARHSSNYLGFGSGINRIQL
jgi:transposase